MTLDNFIMLAYNHDNHSLHYSNFDFVSKLFLFAFSQFQLPESTLTIYLKLKLMLSFKLSMVKLRCNNFL